ncbi:hypothetical protein D3C78_1765400 [compost metagenome]
MGKDWLNSQSDRHGGVSCKQQAERGKEHDGESEGLAHSGTVLRLKAARIGL